MRLVCKPARAVRLGVALCLLVLVASTRPLEAQSCLATTPIGTGNDWGTAVSLQTDGRIVVGAYFDRPGPQFQDIAALRFNADLRLDATFDTDGIATMDIWGNDVSEGMLIQPDGRIVIGGVANNGGLAGCCDEFLVARFNPDGNPDIAFGAPSGNVTTNIAPSWDLGRPIALQTDGKIILGGYVDDGAGNWNMGLVRYNVDGSLDPAFNPGGVYGIAPNNQSMVVTSVGPGDDYGNALALQPDGKILLGGATWNGTDWDWVIVRFQADGNLDGSFGTGGIVTTDLRGDDDWAASMALQPDGKIVLGSKSSNGTDIDFAVARYNADGSLDGTFGTGGMVFTPIGSGDDDGETLTLQTDGKIVLAGYTWNGTDEDFAVVRYNADGSLDNTFGSGGIVVTQVGTGNDRVAGVTVQPDGKIVVAGHSDNGGNIDVAVARYLPDGTLDQSCARYRSTGTSTANLNTSARTVEVSGTTATFSGPMPDNVGVGDVLQYQVAATTYLAVIHGRWSSTVYTVFTTAGATPRVAVAGTAVSVFRAYTSLFNWEALDENDSLDNTVENFDTSTDLVAASTIMRVAAYADGTDTLAVTINGWNTGPANFIEIFTPTNPSEVGTTQRHNGTTGTGYMLASPASGIRILDEYVRLRGLDISSQADAVEVNGVGAANEIRISACLIHDVVGVFAGGVYTADPDAIVYVWNNIFYDFGASGNAFDIDDSAQIFAFNNTISDVDDGFKINGGVCLAKNNIVANATGNNYATSGTGSFHVNSDYNWSDDLTDTGGANDINSGDGGWVDVTFLNEVGNDFHLHPSDTGAQGLAADLSADPTLAFSDDIDGGLRMTPWDIGADDATAALATLSLEEHDLLQVGDRFVTTTPVTDVLFRFRLTSAGTVNVDTLRVNFTTGSGVVNGDVTNTELYVDVDNNGVIGGPDTLVQTGVTPSGGVITFTTNFPTSSAGANYLVRATVANLSAGDSTTFALYTVDIDPVEVGVLEFGTVTNAVHTQDVLLLSDHVAGQVGDRFTTTTPVTDVLYQFALVPSGSFDVTEVRVNFTTASGVAGGDVTGAALWHDVNGNRCRRRW